ncbi:MAG TPA: metallophosphoesterase [Chloroflexi bacterium]|nr:metallophosphoesterase [Chloroflexota bacterium]
MKIGIISDTHDNVGNLARALAKLKDQHVSRVFHCGDVCQPGIIHLLTDFDLWIAQGNMDRHIGLAQTAEELVGPGRLAWLHRPVVDGYATAMIHGDNNEVLGNLITSGQYAYVFHGHTHQRRDQMVGHTRVINPGALGGTRKQSRSFCILDLETNKVQFIELV